MTKEEEPNSNVFSALNQDIPFEQPHLHPEPRISQPLLCCDQHLTYLLSLVVLCVCNFYSKKSLERQFDFDSNFEFIGTCFFQHYAPSMCRVLGIQSISFPASKCVFERMQGLWYGCRGLGALQASGLSWWQEARNSV